MNNKKVYMADLFCDDCDKWYIVEFEYVSELPTINCPECNSKNTWFGDIETDDNDWKEIVMGRGGRRQK